MSETSTTAAPTEPKVILPEIPPIDITRNEVTLPFVIQAETKGKKSEDILPFFMCFDLEALPSWEDLQKWVNNPEWLRKIVAGRLKKLSKDEFGEVYKNSTGADGVFEVTKFTNLFTAAMTEMRFYAEKLKELRARKDALIAQATELASAGDPSKFTEMSEILAQVAILAKDIEAKGRKKATADDDDENEEQNQAAA